MLLYYNCFPFFQIQYKTVLFILILAIVENKCSPKISWDPNIIKQNLDKIILDKQSFVTCSQEEIINLKGLNLNNIPTELIKSKTIEAISLQNNEISIVPSHIFYETPNLQCLDLSRNKILPNNLEMKHNRLQTLILDYQKNLQSNKNEILLPQNTVKIKGQFPNLKTLSWKNFTNDILTSIIASFPRINNIYLSDSNLQYISSNIGTIFPYVKNIHLENNLITELIGHDFRNVEELYLDNNPLYNSIWFDPKFTNLKILSLSNTMRNPPKLNIPSLITLDLSQNRFFRFEEDIFEYTTSLENLIFSKNEFKKFPNLISLNNLKKLSLAYNIITNVNDVSVGKSLQMLSLRGNQIYNIDKQAFSKFTELEFLDLSENKLQSLPFAWNKNLSMLKYLNLESNYFLKIEDMMLNPLFTVQKLYIKNNDIVSIDLDILKIIPQNCTVHVL